MRSNIQYQTPEWARQKDVERLHRSLKLYFSTVGKKESNGDKSFAYSANADWQKAERCPADHEIFIQRKIKAVNLRLLNGQPTAALRNEHGVLMTYLSATHKDAWMTNYSGKLAGCCTLLGELHANDKLIICVDYFSAVSLHMATRLPVAVAFVWLNVWHIVERFAKELPPQNIIIAASRTYQRDIQREQEAEYISNDYNLIKPETDAVRADRKILFQKPETWNDIHFCWGLDEIKRQFSDAGLGGRQ